MSGHERTNPTHAAEGIQEQFLDVVSRDEAERRFRAHLALGPLGIERIPLDAALGRVLACDAVSTIDVPGFDRSNVDGFAVRSADTYGAADFSPRRLRVNPETIPPAFVPQIVVEPGTATPIATGGMLPRGADAVIMVEATEMQRDGGVEITRSLTAGENVAFAGSDIACGETVLRSGDLLTSREIGVLAALGRAEVEVFRRPRVAVLSTGNEIVAPGDPKPVWGVYDSNAAGIAAAVRELGGEADVLGCLRDDYDEIRARFRAALAGPYDAVILSGGTSKGAQDLSYKVVAELRDPGIVAHGVALKPGKPVCLAVTGGRPVVVLPGFPTSALFTFHEFVAPVILAWGGRPAAARETIDAVLPHRVHSERGRTEYLLVRLVPGPQGTAAFPTGKGSGSVTTFAQADGFITIDERQEQLEEGTHVTVTRLGQGHSPVDLVVVGSHCIGLDLLLSELQRRGTRTKAIWVGSQGGLAAARRGECDVAGIHLLDPQTGIYNEPFLGPELELIRGYSRMQGVVHRPGDVRFAGCGSAADVVRRVRDLPDCLMVNRNAGSGTRVLIDRLLEGRQPPGYAVQTKSHNAVAAAIAQGRADWGVAIASAAAQAGLEFLPLTAERYDFAVPRIRRARPGVRALADLLEDAAIQERLAALGLTRDG